MFSCKYFVSNCEIFPYRQLPPNIREGQLGAEFFFCIAESRAN